MGRGKAWDALENEALLRAWITASEDPIVGANHRSKTFSATLHRRFADIGPPAHETPEGKFGKRSVESCRKHLSDISTDMQAFYKALRRVKASKPSGVDENNILSMAIVIHLRETDKMEYKFKDYKKESWINFKAWEIANKHPKWTNIYSSDEGNSTHFEGGNLSSKESENLDPNVVEAGELVLPISNITRASAPVQGIERSKYKTGTKAAKLLRQQNIRTQAVRLMAESAKRKSHALQDRNSVAEDANAIAVYSRPEAQGLQETSKFFEAMRETYLNRALKKARSSTNNSMSAYGNREGSTARGSSDEVLAESNGRSLE